jgi:cell division protein ZapA (FtsZ GTPase activity inhibitor)
VGVKHTVTLEIAGTKFRLVADTEPQRLGELAALVNDRVAKLSAGGKPASAAQLLALVALGLADDLTSTEKKLREVDRLTRTTIADVIARIDERLADVPPPPQSLPSAPNERPD